MSDPTDLLGLKHVISLERTPDRLANFRAHNAHVPGINHFRAVAGAALDRAALIEAGFIRPDNAYVPGALGAMMSHVALWAMGVQQQQTMTIFEDDAILRHDFVPQANRVLAGLPADWDMVLWGSNLDWAAVIQVGPGLPAFGMYGRTDLVPTDIAAFQASTPDPVACKLFSSAGMLAYSVSVKGAQQLMQRCLPFGADMPLDPRGSGQLWANTGFDVDLCRHYPDMQATHCLPPLGYSPNDAEISTIRGNSQQG